MNLTLYPQHAGALRDRVIAISHAAYALGSLGEEDPEMAGECGVEIASLEARTILSGGSVHRIVSAANQAAGSGRPTNVSPGDLESISRLEAIVALGNSRISMRLSALEAQESQEPAARLGSLLGLATSAFGLYKSIF